MLVQLAWSPVLLAFDYDGTLAPIVANRDAATMRRETSRLFQRVSEIYPVAVISGRSQGDVRSRLGRAPVKYVIGNHGLEPGRDLSEFESEMRAVRPALEAALNTTSGIDIEDKRYSLAVHYRRSRNKRGARTAVERAVKALPMPMRIVAGKLVVNIVPARAPNKGDALLELREREQASTALYVGDDVTDEDVFTLDQPGRLVGVRVGESSASSAKYYLRDQREMDVLLERLCDLRAKGGARV